MNSHPDFAQLRVFALGDSALSRGHVARHLLGCHDCRRTIDDVRRVVDVAREEFSPQPSPAVHGRVMARLAAGDIVTLPGDDLRSAPRFKGRMLAGIALLTTVAGMAAAMPGSPGREWLRRLLWAGSPGVATTVSAETERPPEAAAGVAVPLVAGEMWVHVQSARQLRVRVWLTGDSMLDVRGVGGAVASEFQPRANGVSVLGTQSGEVHVRVPRHAVRFVLRVDGKVQLEKIGRRVAIPSSNDTSLTEFVFNVGGTP